MLKFGLAVAIGAGTIWTGMPIAATAVIMLVVVAIAGSALAVLAAEPQTSRALRPQEFATWDGLFAAALAIVGVVLVAGAQPSGALVPVAGAITLAALSLRTRYVTR